MALQEAQYKVTLSLIEKKLNPPLLKEVAEKLGHESLRVNAYLNYRFVRSPQYVVLDGNLRGYCFICNTRIYYTLESACLDCLQKVLAILENRTLRQSSRMKTGIKPALPMMDESMGEAHATDNDEDIPVSFEEFEESNPGEESDAYLFERF